jgi:hypothetical protein
MTNNSFSTKFLPLIFGLILIALMLTTGCATTTHPIDPYPAQTDGQHGTEAYQASDGSITPATGADAAIAAGAAGIDTAFNFRNKHPQNKTDVIYGHCEIVNPGASSPCSSILIMLKNEAGETIYQERTEGNGDFSFHVKRGSNYRFEVKSTRFQVSFEPAPPFQATAEVLVKLQPL